MLASEPRSNAEGAFVLRQILILSLSLGPLTYGARAQATLPAATTASVTAIRAGHFLDVESGRTLANQVILISDGKIQAVGSGLDIPDTARVIDLSTMTVLPGLIDCHTHLADLAGAEPLALLQKSCVTPSPKDSSSVRACM